MAPNVAPKSARFSETNRANAGQPNRETPRISKGFIAFSGCLGKVALERVKGIEPSSSAWEAAALPLSYTRKALAIAEKSSWQPRGSSVGSLALRAMRGPLATIPGIWSIRD